MSGIAFARINSFALGPIDHDSADKIGSGSHARAKIVTIFIEKLSVREQKIPQFNKKEIFHFNDAIKKDLNYLR
jgi:hypothetical protein